MRRRIKVLRVLLIRHSHWTRLLAIALQEQVSESVPKKMHNKNNYLLKRRLVWIAWRHRIYQSTLMLEGDRIAWLWLLKLGGLWSWCVVIVLGELVALRMTCKSNSERRRFPLYGVDDQRYEELEANIVEEFLGFASSRFMSTNVLVTVLAITAHPYTLR